jgi:N-acetylmuramoyl-L-alanine amidase
MKHVRAAAGRMARARTLEFPAARRYTRAMRRALAVLLSIAVASPAVASTLERVDVVAGSAVAVRLDLSAPVEPLVRTLPAAEGLPPRIYLDLPATILAADAAPVTAGAGGLVRVRVGQFDPRTTRVVLDLTGPHVYAVHRNEATITVELVGETPPAPTRPPPTQSVTPQAPPHPPPPLAATPPTTPPAGRRMLIVVDPGHGGRDPGATGIGGVVEKTVTLDIARRLAKRLPTRLPVDVELTRHTDTFIPIDDRIACATDAALFISLHVNAALDPRLHGIEVFFGGEGPTAAASGAQRPLRLGRAVTDALEHRLGDVRTLMRPGDYGVLARNAVPSVLIEVGYLTNAVDVERIRDAAYQDLITEAVVDAVAAFLNDRVPS